jgi:hypothetical protein
MATLGQRIAELWATVGEHYVAVEHDGVAGETEGFLAGDINQITYVLPNSFLAVIIESGRKPHGRPITKRTEAGIKMIEPRVHKLDGDCQATQQVAEPLVRAYVRTKTIAAEQHIAAKERVTLTFENKFLRQSDNFVIVPGKPLFEVRRFALAFAMPKPAAYESVSNHQASVGGENHVWQAALWFNRFDATVKRLQCVAQPPPLLRGQVSVRLGRSVHPRINLIFDSVVIRRAEEQMTHV